MEFNSMPRPQLLNRLLNHPRRHLQLLLRKMPISLLDGIPHEGKDSGVIAGARGVGPEDNVFVLFAPGNLLPWSASFLHIQPFDP